MFCVPPLLLLQHPLPSGLASHSAALAALAGSTHTMSDDAAKAMAVATQEMEYRVELFNR